MLVEKIKKEKIVMLKEELKGLEDSRQKKKTTYKIWDIVVVVILAVLADCNEWTEIEDFAKDKKDFLKRFLKLTGGIPCAKTYERVISIIDSKTLNSIFMKFVKSIHACYDKSFKDIFSFDGKVEKGSSRNDSMYTEKIKPLNVLNVFSDRLQACIEQEIIEDKTNEIPAIPDVIERLNLEGIICTWDALNTQVDNVKAVVGKDGDYCVALKGNQGNFHKDVIDYFNEDRLLIIESGYEGSYMLSREKSHGEIITYEYFQTEDVKWYEDYEKWEKLRSIGLVRKTKVKADGSTVIEKRYYISSLLTDINTFSYAIRHHWNVENKLHWQMDFTFKSDNNTTVNKKALFNLQIIKKFCLKLLNEYKKEKNKSLKRIRKDIARNMEKEIIELFESIRNFDISTIS